MLVFESPLLLLLIILVPPAIFLMHFSTRRGGRLLLPIALWNSDAFIPRQFFMKMLVKLSNLTFWCGVILLLIAFAGPSKVEKEKIYLDRGIDIMIVLDESPSMSSKDFEPNRFIASGEIISKFVESRENDAIGLVTFASEAMVRTAPTTDYETLKQRVSTLKIADLGTGTAIGMGLAVACLHLENSTSEQKIIILITDGINNAGDIPPASAAEIAAKMGVIVYTIGVGSERSSEYEFVDPARGKKISGVTNGEYNEALLQKIALQTGGKYYRASSLRALEGVFKSIDSLESKQKRIRIERHIIPVHNGFILAGLLFIIMYFVIRKVFLREVL